MENPKHEKVIPLVREGSKIIIPEGMSIVKAMQFLDMKRIEDEEIVKIHAPFDVTPLDGALALTRALAEMFGWQRLVPTPGFFTSHPPVMINMHISLNETVQVPWGRIMLPDFEDGCFIEASYELHESMTRFVLKGQVKCKFRGDVDKIIDMTRKFLTKSSAYKGKAIVIKFTGLDDPDTYDPTKCPVFLDTSKTNPEELVLSEEARDGVEVALFTPIENIDACRKAGIPLKRGILLEGPFGTGKTLTAAVAAKKCEENGWTFVYVEKTSDLHRALQFAKQYQPSVVFAEDIDQVTDNQDERDEKMNAIFNKVDGVELKHAEMIVVYTTNHVERISQAMIRPGRLDAVITVGAPDEGAIEKLIRKYGRGLVEPKTDLREVCAALNGQIPALVREVVERSKLAAVNRTKRHDTLVNGEDLLRTARGMLKHMELLKPREVKEYSSEEHKAASTLGDAIREAAEKIAGVTSNGKSGSHRAVEYSSRYQED